MRYKIPGMRLQLLGQHVTTTLQVWLWLLLFVFQNEFKISRSSVPGYLDFDNLPDTNFSCAGKVIGGYYADVETSCQMFHVCTIGQQDEPMDIKFLCLNGTVFDQETRVCERVDEVDCSKTEKFYSLNLELYGNTAPPIVEENHEKDEENHELPEDDYEDTEVAFIETTTTTTQQPTSTSTSSPSTTKQPSTRNSYLPSRNSSPASTIYNHDNDDFEQHDGEIDGYYINGHKFLQNHPTHENNNMQPNMESLNHGPSPHQFHSDLSQNTHKYNNPETTSGYNIPNHSSMKHPNNPEQPHGFVNNHKNSHDPSQKTEAISFQHQVFPNSGHNPPITVTTHNSEDNMHNDNEMTQDNSDVTYANKIYITTSTPEVEKRKPESYQSIVPLRKPSNQQQAPTIHPILNQPKPNFNNPVVHFNLRNPPLVPQGFKPSQPTQNPPPSQIQSPAQGQRGQNKFATNRPIQSFQPSENHEILIDASFKLPEGPPLGQHDYSPYHFEPSKRSHDQALRANKADDDILKAEIKATDQEQEEWTPKRHIPKSPPKVIITASASVSDSNGKKLNYTVGNVVHAVQSIVPVNYDDYKESDIISDPFFLDVPKIKRKRTRRHERYSTNKRLSKRSVVFETHESNSKNSTPFSGNKDLFVIDTHFEFNSTSKSFEPIINNHHSASYDQKKYIPLDYVDDNYEPIIYREVITNRNDIKNITDNKTDVNKTTHTNKPNKKEENEAYIKEMENRLLREVLIIHGNRKKEKLGDKVFQEDKKIEYSRIFNITTIPPFVSMTNAINTASDTTKNNIVNYSLTKVQIELLNGQTKNISETFSCKNRTFHIPYAGINDCNVFHLCSPGYNKQQVVNLMYQCDTGTYFNIGSSLCMEKKPIECKH